MPLLIAVGCGSSPSTPGGAGGGGGTAAAGAGGGSDAGGSASGGTGGRDAGIGGADESGGGAGSGGAAGGPGDAGGSDAPPISCTPGSGTEPVGAGSLLDRKTCLVWQKMVSGAMTNKQAAKYCDELTQDGFSDWRTPRPEELATWPNLTADSNAYITGPTYIPSTAASVAEGCSGNSHSCNLTEYNAGSIACAWQGVGFVGPAVCVRSTAAPASLATTYAAATCDACRAHVTGAAPEFKIADCLGL
ncbi:MAG TPA: DUF1566 domain-containing protein [Polyangia bacterium]|nr:DUF1566 domain-containing protein [Polyangia bacterium]